MYDLVLIGGGGYVGSEITDFFLNKNKSILIVDNYIYDHSITQVSYFNKNNIDFLSADFSSEVGIDRIIESSKGSSNFVILGGLVGDPITKKHPNEANRVNNEGIQKLLKSIDTNFIKAHIIFISTCSNYGRMPEGILADEKSELMPLSLYATAKVQAEKFIVNILQPNSKNIYTILRFATAFGLSKRMRFDLTINQFARSLALGEKLVVFDADTWRAYCHIKDFARLIDIVQNSPVQLVRGEIFNAGGDSNNYTKRNLINQIIKITQNQDVVYQNDMSSDPRNYKVDFTKVKTQLSFSPNYSVVDGIKEVVNAVSNGFFHGNIDNNNIFGNYDVKL